MLHGLAVAAPERIPFRLSEGLILVGTTVRGHEGSFVFALDSGAEESLVSRDFAKTLDLAERGRARVMTVSGTTTARRVEGVALTLGSSASHSLAEPLALDLRSESKAAGVRLDGLLGADFFAGRRVKIDFRRRELVIGSRDWPADAKATLAMTRSAGGMFVKLDADGCGLGRVRIDTGCNRSLCWTAPPGSAVSAPWGKMKRHRATVSLGGAEFGEVAAELYRKPLFPGEDGLLGTGFMANFGSVWIDAAAGRVAFR